MSHSIRQCLVSAVLMLLASRGAAQDKPDPKEFAKRGQPGPEHEKLKALFGTDVWFLTYVPEGGTAGHPGTAVYKSILGGRFITAEVKIPFGGITMEWFGIYGYDTNKKKYTAVWVDNMDTTTESGEGEIDAKGTSITFKGEHVDPRTGKPAPFKWRISRDDGKTMSIDMFEIDAAGKEKKVFSVRGSSIK